MLAYRHMDVMLYRFSPVNGRFRLRKFCLSQVSGAGAVPFDATQQTALISAVAAALASNVSGIGIGFVGVTAVLQNDTGGFATADVVIEANTTDAGVSNSPTFKVCAFQPSVTSGLM